VGHEPSTDVLHLLRCGVAEESYALDMASVRDIHRGDGFRKEAGGDGSIGILCGKDGDVPVFSLARLLGRTFRWPAPAPLSPWERGKGEGAPVDRPVVVMNGPRPWALLMDEASPMAETSARSVFPMPAFIVDPKSHPFQGILLHDGELLLLLAPDRLRGDPFPFLRPIQPLAKPPFMRHPPSRRGQLILFTTADPSPQARPLFFGLSITQVLEIVGPPPLVPVPGAPDFVRGLVPWRGQPVPVLDLSRILGLPPAAQEPRSRLLIAAASPDSDPVAFLVRPSMRVAHLPLPHQPCRRDLSVDTALTLGAFELRNETLVLLDLGKVSRASR
jgi:chemotaxis signal transduction protein